MERTKVESAVKTQIDTVKPADDDLRTLQDNELTLVGGAGDDQPSWNKV